MWAKIKKSSAEDKKGQKNIVVCYLKIIKLKPNIQKSENEIL